MKDNYIKFDINKIDVSLIEKLEKYISLYPSQQFLLNVSNTRAIGLEDIEWLENNLRTNRIKIRVEGGYTNERVKNYSQQLYVDMHKYDNVYTLDEMKCILREIAVIEKGINREWSPEQKLIYFIGYLKNKIIYHPFYEHAPSYEIRSLRGLISHKTVCAGYAMILKELCDRNGIYCEYVEGVCKKEDIGKGSLTHAWNIVRIMGYDIPIDLTWNASKSKSGKTLSLGDIANVNEFVKTHFPGEHERIQDYEHSLKSIDGKFIHILNNLVNKDMTYDSASMRCRNDKGEEFLITQVEERVIDNENLYTYIYSRINKDGQMGGSLMFYSKTNVASIVCYLARKRQLERSLAEARKYNRGDEVLKLEKALIGSEYLEDANWSVDNLLFSKTNMEAAIKRQDFYLGEIKVSEEKPRKVDGIYIDINYGKKIGKISKIFTRSNGTSFILEDWNKIHLNNGGYCYRYKMYEFVTIAGKMVLKKNTIYTDQDLFKDGRKSLVDDFLARNRIDRKLRETGGYLGYYSRDGVRTFNPDYNEVFKSIIYGQYRINRDLIRDYYKELSFDDMKRMVRTYTIKYDDGTERVVNRQSGREVTDEVLCLQVKFSHLWLVSAGVKWMSNDIVAGETYAFDEGSTKDIFEFICQSINMSINRYGTIDTIEILKNVQDKYGDYKYATDIVVSCFRDTQRIGIVRDLFRMQNPSVFKTNRSYEVPLVDKYRGETLLDERRRKLEEYRRQLLEVVKVGDRVEIKRKK